LKGINGLVILPLPEHDIIMTNLFPKRAYSFSQYNFDIFNAAIAVVVVLVVVENTEAPHARFPSSSSSHGEIQIFNFNCDFFFGVLRCPR
jgi:hypothetical protein